MILFCEYGVDPSDPAAGVVRASYDRAPAGVPHSGCIAVPYDGAIEALGKFGPEPELMGEAPRSHFASHVELDEEEVAADHPRRALAGRPITQDNRRVAADMRPFAAPQLTLEVARAARAAEIEAAHDAAHDGGFVSSTLGKAHRYPSDAEAAGKMQMAAIAALSGQSKPGWTATLRCAALREGTGSEEATSADEPTGVPHKAAQVHQVVGDFQAFSDALQAKRDALLARIAGAPDVGAALAVAWG